MKASEQLLKSGDYFVNEGLVNPDDIEMALSIQQKRMEAPVPQMKRLFGMILCDLNLITPVDNYFVLHKYNKLTSIESALISEELLSHEQVSHALTLSSQDNTPLISCLIKDNLIPLRQMQTFLFGLFHIPFRSISDFSFNQKDKNILMRIIDRQRAEEHRVVPLSVKGTTILFGITEPDNLLLIRQLNDQFPQYRFKALFIPYSGFVWFSKVVYARGGEEEKSQIKSVNLSSLLGFKAAVKDPEVEKKEIWILYERYELLRHIAGNARRGNFQDEFNLFIQREHMQIKEKYKCNTIEYSFKKDGKNVSIAALPKL